MARDDGAVDVVRRERDLFRRALERIADEEATSMRWRARTSGGRAEKPNVRVVAREALRRAAR